MLEENRTGITLDVTQFCQVRAWVLDNGFPTTQGEEKYEFQSPIDERLYKDIDGKPFCLISGYPMEYSGRPRTVAEIWDDAGKGASFRDQYTLTSEGPWWFYISGNQQHIEKIAREGITSFSEEQLKDVQTS